MNTIDCSPIERNGLSSWFFRGTIGGGSVLIGEGFEDSQESAWLEPRSVFGRVEPHLYEYPGARP